MVTVQHSFPKYLTIEETILGKNLNLKHYLNIQNTGGQPVTNLALTLTIVFCGGFIYIYKR